LKIEVAHGSTGLLPRSEILSRLADLELLQQKQLDAQGGFDGSIRAIVAKAKTLDDIPNTLSELSQLEESVDKLSGEISRSLLPSVRDYLSVLQRTHEEYKAGLKIDPGIPTRRFFSRTVEAEAVALSLKQQLQRLVLPRALGLPESVKLDENETVEHFFDRIQVEAREKGDADFLLLVQNVKNQMNQLKGPPAALLTNELQPFVAAQHQEAAGQFALAVASYQTALQSGSNAIPPKVIGSRLDAIKATHPKEFEEGMRIFLTQPAVAPTPTPSASATPQKTPTSTPAGSPSPEVSSEQ
jgi:hypothetical protein